MDISIAQKLFEAMKRFNKAQFNQHPIKGVKQSEMVLMFYVKKSTKPNAEGLKVSEISEMLGVTSPTVTQLLNSLEVKGWIERTVDQKDRRAVRVKLSDEGELVIQKAIKVTEASFNELINHLGEEDSNQLADLLIKAYQYYEQKEMNLTQSGDDKRC
ncbi:MarR family winged helix-turn-helix transcriptional regulator [Paenibacillus sp. FA6]|uniref:MarR family winged helix-turn-helix transcriptional regulator n=1 Tax=Paenibacillus sp. FA6 TaxID=3413029 RepID=UPI003F65D6E6